MCGFAFFLSLEQSIKVFLARTHKKSTCKSMAGVWSSLKFDINLCSRGTGPLKAPLQHCGSTKAQTSPCFGSGCLGLQGIQIIPFISSGNCNNHWGFCNPTFNDLNTGRSSSSEISRTGSVFRESVDICLQIPFKSLVEITPVKKNTKRKAHVLTNSYQRMGLREAQESKATSLGWGLS